MDSTYPGRERSRAFVAASLALALVWSGSSLARTQPETDCADVAKRLQSLDIPAESFTVVAPVDHVPVLTETTDLVDTVDADDMPTPLISLAPRAESALRDIFDDAEADVVPAAAPSSPVAETEELPDISELPDNVTPAVAGDEDIDLPMLQRRMFRIDI